MIHPLDTTKENLMCDKGKYVVIGNGWLIWLPLMVEGVFFRTRNGSIHQWEFPLVDLTSYSQFPWNVVKKGVGNPQASSLVSNHPGRDQPSQVGSQINIITSSKHILLY